MHGYITKIAPMFMFGALAHGNGTMHSIIVEVESNPMHSMVERSDDRGSLKPDYTAQTNHLQLAFRSL